jgi:hypothetical protein
MSILDLLQVKKDDTLVIGKIYEKRGDRYYIQDKKNRTHVASSFSTYSVGVTVVVRQGFIISTVSDYKSIPTFVV